MSLSRDLKLIISLCPIIAVRNVTVSFCWRTKPSFVWVVNLYSSVRLENLLDKIKVWTMKLGNEPNVPYSSAASVVQRDSVVLEFNLQLFLSEIYEFNLKILRLCSNEFKTKIIFS